MSRDRASLLDILASIDSILQYVSGLTFEDFERDVLRQDAVIRRFEVIGEATKRLSETLTDAHPAVPWRQMAGMRDRVIHGYDVIDLNIVWDTIQNDLSSLRTELQSIIDTVSEPPPEQSE